MGRKPRVDSFRPRHLDTRTHASACEVVPQHPLDVLLVLLHRQRQLPGSSSPARRCSPAHAHYRMAEE